RLVGGLEPDAVDLAVDGREVDPALRVVVLDGGQGVVRERHEVAVLRELLHEGGLTNDGDVGRGAALDLRAEGGRGLVAEARVVDLRAGLLLELGEDRLEVLLLVAGPGGRDLERRARELAVPSAAVTASGASGEHERCRAERG